MLFPPTFPPGADATRSPIELIATLFPMAHTRINGLYEVPQAQTPNSSPVFRNKICADTSNHELVTSIHPAIQTIHDFLLMAFAHHASHRCLGTKTPEAEAFEFSTYREVEAERAHFGAGLVHLIRSLGFAHHNVRARLATDNDFILTVFAPNTYEWIITDMACSAYDISTTTLYDTLGADSSSYILSVTRSAVVLLTSDKVASFLSMIQRDGLSFIKALVVLDAAVVDPPSESTRAAARKLGIELHTYAELRDQGQARPLAFIPPTPDSLYTISFTSGTSGNPKGVELSHRSAVAGLTAVFVSVATPDLSLTNASTFQSLCILPLAHVYQRLILYFELCSGGTVHLPSNPRNPKQIMKDIAVVKPTHLIGVPRIFNRIDASITTKIKASNYVTRLLYQRCMTYKHKQHKAGNHVTSHWLYDGIFIKKIKAAAGLENLQLAVSGSAPMLPETIKSLRYVLSTPFLQGYGLTESFACIAVPLPGDELEPVSSG